MLTKTRLIIIATAFVTILSQVARATEADDTTITITGQFDGATPLIKQLTLTASNTLVLRSIQFAITPKAGSVTRPFSATYSNSYLVSRGYLQPLTGDIFLPVYGLYGSSTNTVTLTYYFFDGSSKEDSTTLTTEDFDDPCGLKTPTILQARTSSTDLSYDYIFVRGACNPNSPVIIDTDGAVRWISPFASTSVLLASSGFFDGAAYVTLDSSLYRVDLDGTVTLLADYSDSGVVNFHHNIDPGKKGIVLDADTDTQVEAVNMEVDGAGKLLKTWNMADIISAAMTAGGDDPGEFVFPAPTDWFHNNATTYRKSDNSLLASSRENFVIAIDYDTSEIKWILGDSTKKWFEFPSLSQFALALGPDSLPPIGQHSLSFTHEDDLLLFDNGLNSIFQTPPGENRTYSTPRKYQLDLETNVATEIWNYPRDESVDSRICSSVYEDAPSNYLLDYAFIVGPELVTTAEILGLTASGDKVFDYSYPTGGCNTAYNSLPIHAEQLLYSTAGQALDISTRGSVLSGDDLVGGFIITGFDSKDVVLRAIGPSLSDTVLSGPVLANPLLTLYDSSGTVIATNDDWQTDAGAGEIEAQGLAPTNAVESATLQSLAPGAYTFAVSGQDASAGVALVEAYDLSRNSNSTVANISTRSFVGTGDDVLIAGFILGNRNDAAVVLRGLGPSLAALEVNGVLADPTLTVYDADGVAIASNDNWADDAGATLIGVEGLAPTDPAEAATLVPLSPGSYTAILSGVGGGTGVGLVEVYNLP